MNRKQENFFAPFFLMIINCFKMKKVENFREIFECKIKKKINK